MSGIVLRIRIVKGKPSEAKTAFEGFYYEVRSFISIGRKDPNRGRSQAKIIVERRKISNCGCTQAKFTVERRKSLNHGRTQEKITVVRYKDWNRGKTQGNITIV